MKNLSGNLNRQTMSAQFQKKGIGINFNQKLSIVAPTHHSQLLGLSYEESGHTGFASERALKLVEDKTVPRRLSMVDETKSTDDRTKMWLFVDNNGVDAKVSVQQVLSKVIRTAEEQPVDMQTGEYLMLIKE